MEIFLWGVRGTIPNATHSNQFYGANTSCVEARLDDGSLLIFDAGTGIRSLSKTLPDRGECHIFISHAHSDHVQGLTFFQPLFLPRWTVRIYIPEWLEDLPRRLFDNGAFPVSFSDLRADIHLRLLREGDAIPIGTGTAVSVYAANHPNDSLAFKVSTPKATFFYSGDHEITPAPAVREKTLAMLRDADAALVDASFSREDFMPGWGHSTWEDWKELASEANVKTLILSHHMPDRKDAELDALQKQLSAAPDELFVAVAREGMHLSLPGPINAEATTSSWMDDFISALSQYKEESVLLDRILSKTRKVTNAEAGSIYLTNENHLVFAYSHNDILFSDNSNNKSAYVNMRLPITEESISGYVAATGNCLNIPDVHCLPPDVPYSFNEGFDKKTGYRTTSMLTIPIVGHDKTMLGVLQLINSRDPRTGEYRPFSDAMRHSVQALAREAAAFMEISNMTRENIYALLRTAKIHDPSETGPHAERVGALAAEIYQRFAEKNKNPIERVRHFKSQLRLAAMLHDIGKVGISDIVLKKPAKLTDEEFAIMRTHTKLGAELFANTVRDISHMAHEIALHHHQRWDGKGYPVVNGKTLAGTDIPLSARLVAIADVFDALVSPRCYKKAWSFEKAQYLVREEAGKHFDPELVDCFFDIFETVAMIYQRYPDSPAEASPVCA